MSAWDDMSKTYPRYGDNAMMGDIKVVLDFAKNFGISFEGEILDIGCGTGVLAIDILLNCLYSKIIALDISEGMLEILREDAKKFHVEDRINIVRGDFNDFASSKFDLVIASMSPAICSLNCVDKLISLTKNYGLYVGWGSYKRCDFLNAITPESNPSVKGCIKTQQMSEILDSRGIEYGLKLFETSWENIMPLDKAYQYANAMRARCQLQVDKKLVDETIKRFSDSEGFVHIKTEAQKGVIAFRV